MSFSRIKITLYLTSLPLSLVLSFSLHEGDGEKAYGIITGTHSKSYGSDRSVATSTFTDDEEDKKKDYKDPSKKSKR